MSLKAFPLNILINQKMDKATEVILSAFERRAKEVCRTVESDGVDLDAEYVRLGLENLV